LLTRTLAAWRCNGIMSDIFISYASEDLNAARRLAAVLESQGWSVFWDRRIPAGKVWREVIGAALAEARCVVVLWSQHSVNSHWVQEEADYGLKRRVLIPALIESVHQPLGFGSIQAADLSTWDGNHEDAVLKQFFRDLAGVLGPAPVVPTKERPKAQAEAKQKASEQRRQQDEAEAIRDTLEPSEPKPGTVFRDIEAPWCPELIVIPAGEFMMGSTAAERKWAVAQGANPEWVKPERPQHLVRITYRLAVGRYPVTFEEYEQFCRQVGRKKPADEDWGRGRRPVINVSWEDAQAYFTWLSEQTGQPYRLPSEAEWEYACRAGTTTPFWTGATISTDQANYDGRDTYGIGRKGKFRQKTTAVGRFEANLWGLHDMHGNVWEWCEDWWHDSYKGAPEDGSAWLKGGSAGRVVRGGSWHTKPWNIRAASRRDRIDPSSHRGFRVARTV
jgi:formylglycine-generating enzyme required for sulfatase activity